MTGTRWTYERAADSRARQEERAAARSAFGVAEAECVRMRRLLRPDEISRSVEAGEAFSEWDRAFGRCLRAGVFKNDEPGTEENV